MPTERLDVEDDDHRHIRLRHLLQRINDGNGNSNSNNNSSSSTAFSNNAPFVGPGPSSSLSFDFGVRETHAVEPPRELLARVEAFLPQMEAANAELVRCVEEGGTESVDIEAIGDGEEEGHIEMNVGLGVFDIGGGDRRASGSSSSANSDADSRSDESHSPKHSDADGDDASHGTPSDVSSSSVIGRHSLQTTISHHRIITPLPNRVRPLRQSTPPSSSPEQC